MSSNVIPNDEESHLLSTTASYNNTQHLFLDSHITNSPNIIEEISIANATNSKMFYKLTSKDTIPVQQTTGSVGSNLTTISSPSIILLHIQPLFLTGICLNSFHVHYGRIVSCSGLLLKSGIEVGAGVIDIDYTGELNVLLFNLSNQPVTIKLGQHTA